MAHADFTPSEPTYHLAPAPNLHPQRKYLAIAAAIVIIILGAGALYRYTSIGPALQLIFIPTHLPPDLAGATFYSDPAIGTTVADTFDASGKVTKHPGPEIVSATKSPAGAAQITHGTDGTFAITLNGALVLQDHYPRIGISLSPDGKSIAYAQIAAAPPGVSLMTLPSQAPTIPIRPTEWNVVIYQPSVHTTIPLGTGVSPFFLDQTHVVWIAPAGLSMADLGTGTSTVLVHASDVRASSAMLVSPDHSIVAWYAPASQYLLQAYKIADGHAVALPATTLVTPVRSIALGNDGVYTIRTVGLHRILLKQAFGQPAMQVGSMPLALGISRMLLGSI